MGKKAKYRIVQGIGDPCPRCGKQTQIREHIKITERETRRPFFYVRWFRCHRSTCKTTLIMPPRYIAQGLSLAEIDEINQAVESGELNAGECFERIKERYELGVA